MFENSDGGRGKRGGGDRGGNGWRMEGRGLWESIELKWSELIIIV